VDDQQRILYTNRLAEQQFGAGKALAGRSVHHVLPVRADAWQEMIAEHRRSLGDSEHDGEFETSGKRAYQYRFFPMPLGHNGKQTVGIVIWDVTEHKQLQDQLMQADKLASLGTLISGIAHEINNPVQGILTMAEIIAEDSKVDNIKQYANEIIEYSKHVRTVIYDLACYARPGSRTGEVQVDLQERLLEAVKMVRRCPDFGDVEVVTVFDCPHRLYARQAEIDQVFVNLISNAVQAMERKGRLTLRTWTSGSTLMVSIADTGCGIPSAVTGKIFDPFFTTKEPGKGTGLGLSIVHRLVSKYGGTISVESEEGKGTTFTIQFPMIQQPQK
jgi:PAS domain S-box-containing protein